jgi:AcrR family transcriptional regulator
MTTSLVITPRFVARRARIIDAASAMINERGVRGLSLGAVAEQLGLTGTGLSYYFRRKDLLAAACFERALDRLEEQIGHAARAPDTGGRIARLIALAIEDTATEDPARPVIAWLTDLRALDDPARDRLTRRYGAIAETARQCLFADGNARGGAMRTHMLLESIHALPDWLPHYAREDHPRVATRLTELLVSGLLRTDIPPPGVAIDPPAADAFPVAEEGRARFMAAATTLINQRGYRGASVERIAAALAVTKGSFYHHLDAKDDLVLACFRASLATVAAIQNAAAMVPGPALDRLAAALRALIGVQFGTGTPLLRSTALAALPPELRPEAVAGSQRIERRFAGMVIDGISDGSIAPIDPLVAGHWLMSALDAAIDLRAVETEGDADPQRTARDYLSAMLGGLVAPPATGSDQ